MGYVEAISRNNPWFFRADPVHEMHYPGDRWPLLPKPLPFRHPSPREEPHLNRKLLH